MSKGCTTTSIKCRVTSISYNGIVLEEGGVYLAKSLIRNWPTDPAMEKTYLNTKDKITLIIPEWVAVQRGLA